MLSGEDETRAVYEVWIHGCGSREEAIGLQEPIARVLCPDELHRSPCEVPWGFSLAESEDPVLVLGIYATAGQARRLVERIGATVGSARRAVLRDGHAGLFDELVEQYRIERG